MLRHLMDGIKEEELEEKSHQVTAIQLLQALIILVFFRAKHCVINRQGVRTVRGLRLIFGLIIWFSLYVADSETR